MSTTNIDDRPQERRHPLAPFTAIDAAGGVSVELSLGTPADAIVIASADTIGLAELAVGADGILRVGRKAPPAGVPWRTILVRLITPRCERLGAREGARIVAEGGSGGANVAVKASSGGVVTMAMTGEQTARVKATDGAAVTLTGVAGALHAEVAGGAALRAAALEVRRAVIDVTAGALAELNAAESVRGSATWGAQLRLARRPPEVDVTTSGGAVLF